MSEISDQKEGNLSSSQAEAQDPVTMLKAIVEALTARVADLEKLVFKMTGII